MRAMPLLALLTLPVAAEELSGTQLAKLKDATVYVKHVGFRGLETGSGYLFRKDGKTGWVLTCEHVVRDTETATVVLKSGREGELKVEALVVFVDKERDVACLRFKADEIPSPVELALKTEVKETESVYVAGFPFGPSLSTAGDNPAPSVTKVSVSAVRRDDAGECVVVQLSGDVNPGNSGGPVIDGRGRLVGIATSRISGTEMVFLVPPEGLRAILKGRVLKVGAKSVAASGVKPRLEITAPVFDPLGKLQSWGVSWIRRDALREAPAAGADGKWKPAAASMKDAALVLDESKGVAAGAVDVNRAASEPVAIPVVFQAWWVGADGTKVWAEPVEVEARVVEGR
ncbi:MAG: trypsin-like serine protease with C-terminal PDZ [Planctomycetota bacterium]|nr:MAG: trypsin-like serine protease with C-terminal PDZ [Planctomycetota bacterium]